MSNVWLDLFIVIVFLYATHRGINKTADRKIRQEREQQQKLAKRKRPTNSDDDLESMESWFEPGTRAEDYQ